MLKYVLPFLLMPFLIFSKQIDLAICTIFQNDAKYLPEWIDFHKKQGVQKFFLYSNKSEDNYKEILEPYIKEKTVKLIEWNYQNEDIFKWNDTQCLAYMHCINKIKDKVKWCAFIDSDEFIFCVNGEKLPKFLKKYKDFPGICVNWCMYGTSKIYHIPYKKRMIDTLLYRAKKDYAPNIHVKTIVQTKFVIGCENPHYFLYHDYQLAVTENKIPMHGPFSPSISWNKIRINHYWARDGHFFETEKCARRLKWNCTIQDLLQMESNMNDIYDPILKN